MQTALLKRLRDCSHVFAIIYHRVDHQPRFHKYSVSAALVDHTLCHLDSILEFTHIGDCFPIETFETHEHKTTSCARQRPDGLKIHYHIKGEGRPPEDLFVEG